MAYNVTISNPEYIRTGGVSGATLSVDPISFALSKEIGRGDLLEFEIVDTIAEKYFHETLAANPIQLNSVVEVTQADSPGKCIFYGSILERPETVDYEYGRALLIRAGDPIYALGQCVAPDAAGGYGWIMETLVVKLPEIDLIPFHTDASKHYGSFVNETLWPDLASDAWFTGLNAPLKDNILDNSTVIYLTTGGDAAGFYPRGFVVIESEWIYFPTIWWDGANDRYVLGSSTHPCIRGCLGTVAAAHNTPLDVTNMIAKYIAPGGYQLYVDEPVTGWREMDAGNEYTMAPKSGCVVYSGITSGLSFKGYYHIYDPEPSGAAVSVADVVRAMLEGNKDYGGAGIDPGDINIDVELETHYITRYTCPAEDSVSKSIEGFLSALGYMTFGETARPYEVAFYFDHDTKEYCLRYLPNASLAHTFYDVTAIQKDIRIDDLYTGVIVKWQADQSGNELVIDRGWHDACGGAGEPTQYQYGYSKNPAYEVEIVSSGTSAGNSSLDALFHGYTTPGGDKIDKRRTFSCQYWNEDDDPAGPNIVPHSYWWFSNNFDARKLKKLNITVGAWRTIKKQDTKPADGMVQVSIYGTTSWGAVSGSYTPLFPDDPSAWTRIMNPFKVGMGDNAVVSFSFDTFINPGPWNCIAIVFDYMAGSLSVGDYNGTLYNLEMETEYSGGGTTLVQLTDDDTEASEYKIYAPESFQKLRYGLGAATGVPGMQRVARYSVPGGSSEGAAISLARIFLETSLLLFMERQYQYDGEIINVPKLGEKIEVEEDILYGPSLPAAGRYKDDLFIQTGSPAGLYKWDGSTWGVAIIPGYKATFTGILRRLVLNYNHDQGSTLNMTLFDYTGSVIQ